MKRVQIPPLAYLRFVSAFSDAFVNRSYWP